MCGAHPSRRSNAARACENIPNAGESELVKGQYSRRNKALVHSVLSSLPFLMRLIAAIYHALPVTEAVIMRPAHSCASWRFPRATHRRMRLNTPEVR